MRKWVFIMIIVGLTIPQFSYCREKIQFTKEKFPLKKHKIHPVEKYFAQNENTRHEILKRQKDENFNKLLVLLIEFQPDDDPTTTGDGTFIQEDSLYAVSFGKAPHNQAYFEAHLEALRYYYQAVSMGQYNLEFDVYPQNAADLFEAYTLPNPMAYYNQIDADPDLMIERFEEYFTHALQKADEDGSIDFSRYGHFMFIHAGADWQHDTQGDTFKDIPSFFIQMGDGKEYTTNEGVIIDHACNVPEMITQDVYENGNEVYGYGVINSVMAHEFGHSLGYVDLYNVNSFRPEVGYFDIMDSGGAGLLGYGVYNEQDELEKVYYIEGGLPTLPGAWTRLLVQEWKEHFETQGYYQTNHDLNFDEPIQIRPAGYKTQFGVSTPYIINIPISDHEYLLIENRQVDPDGDGGIRFVADLPETPGGNDHRVLLYPSSTNPNDFLPNYEYDYLLPGWIQASNGHAIGGGLVIWHIDDDIIYGNDNFDNNYVNIDHLNRGVKIIEADNLQDIGNVYSYFWQGTAYEPYFKYMPVLDKSGFFLRWDSASIPNPDGTSTFIGHYANQELSSISKPALLTNDGIESFYKIYNISSYSIEDYEVRDMTFSLGTNLFESSEQIFTADSIKTISPVALTNMFFPNRTELLVMKDNGTSIINHIYNEELETWTEFAFEDQFDPTQPLISSDINQDDSEEYGIVEENKITWFNSSGIIETQEFSSEITQEPLYVNSTLVVPTANNLLIDSMEYPIPNASVCVNNDIVMAVSGNKVYFISIETEMINESYDLPTTSSDHQPVCYNNISNEKYTSFFVQTDDGEIVKFSDNKMETIFNIEDYQLENPTQLSIHFDDEKNVPFLFFGAGNKVFKIDIFGTLASGFPARMESQKSLAKGFPSIFKKNNKIIHLLPAENNNYVAFDQYANVLPEYSYRWLFTENHYLYWEELTQRLYFIYSDTQNSNDQVFASYISYQSNQSPILWSGFRNQHTGTLEGLISEENPSQKMVSYAYPNPAGDQYVRIKIQNALSDIDLAIYDIAGNRIVKKKITKTPTDEQDFVYSIKNLASGMYFGIVNSRNQTDKFSFAIEK